jgi:5-oxoprolinase (ATP-hydrolysing) subunit C
MSTTLTVLSPGLHTLVVDAGRPRSRSLGVPVGGAADRFALAVGNALVGNPPDAAALEVSLVGPTLVADSPLACVLWGAPFAIATRDRDLHAGTTFTLEAGEELRVGGTSRGMRAYLCVAGGIDAPLVLGSRSSLSPLAAGARLACREGRVAGRRADLRPESPRVLRVLPGAQADWFPQHRLTRHEVTPVSNRMGLRLCGDPFPAPPRELVSEPVCPGAVQVTRDGQCIVLGVDGQTIGGYPKVGQVVAADLDRVGQLRPGNAVEFEYVTPAEADRLWRERAAALREWVTRLRLSAGAVR